MAQKAKLEAKDIRIQVFNKPATVRNGSGAYVSSVQTVKNAKKAAAAKAPARKKAKH